MKKNLLNSMIENHFNNFFNKVFPKIILIYKKYLVLKNKCSLDPTKE